MDGKGPGSSLNASLLLDGEDRILEGNRDAEVFLEKPLEEVRKSFLYQANPSLYAALKDLIGKSRRGRGVEDYALAYKVGKRLMRLNVSITPYPLEALGTTGTLVTISALGARPLPERRVPEQEKLPLPVEAGEALGFTRFLDALVEPAFMVDADAVFTYVNPAMRALLGYAEDEIIGRPLSFFMLREEAKKSLDYLVEAARSAPWRGELELSRADGTTCNIAVTVEPLRTEGHKKGEAETFLAVGRDNTTEARVRRERKEELERVWNLLESVGSATICFTPDLRVTLLSRSAGELLRITRDRAIGSSLPELFPGDTAKEIATLLELALKGEVIEGAEVRMARVKGEKRGEGRTLAVEVRPAVSAGDKVREYIMFMKEITQEISEVEKARLQLAEYETRLKWLDMAVACRDLDSYLSRCLSVLESDLGCSAAAVFTLGEREVRLHTAGGLSEEGLAALREFKLRPGQARACDGMQELEVEIHGGVPKKGWSEMQSFIEKADRLLPLFRENRWRKVLVMPLRVEETVGVLALIDCHPDKLSQIGRGALQAISETMARVLSAYATREKELGDPAVKAERSRRLAPESAETVASGEESMEDGAAGRERADTGFHATSGPAEHDLLEVAAEAKKIEPAQNHLPLWGEDDAVKVSPSPRGIDLHSLILEIREYYARRGHGGEIFLEIEDDLPKLHTDKRMLRESIMHLLDNAIRYSPPGAPVILGVERWGDEILLRVEDQGPGIPAEVVEEVMRAPNHDQEGGSPGAGQRRSGLFLTRKYVAAMGGDLTIKGKADEGTTAFIRIRVLPFVGEEI